MTRQILATIALLLTLDTAGAVRVLEQIERGVELTLGDLSLPTGDNGAISFSECPRCGVSTHRLTDATVYEFNGQTLAWPEFLRIVGEVRQRSDGNDSTIAAVFLDIASGRVTRIEVRE
jgi:hypothetical protein